MTETTEFTWREEPDSGDLDELKPPWDVPLSPRSPLEGELDNLASILSRRFPHSPAEAVRYALHTWTIAGAKLEILMAELWKVGTEQRPNQLEITEKALLLDWLGPESAVNYVLDRWRAVVWELYRPYMREWRTMRGGLFFDVRQLHLPETFPATLKTFFRLVVKGKTEEESTERMRDFLTGFPLEKTTFDIIKAGDRRGGVF